ncbi:MAG: YggW family oxidoreductase, partial [Proteobacteria bacterium]|nr:YggW family oxidoreductase [Pseudomonadota bacterium]
EKSFMAGIKVIEKKDMPLEFMLNGLRLVNGFTWEQFEKRTGLILSDVEDKVELLATKGLLKNSLNALQPTEKGHQYLNFVLEEFLD